MPFSIAPGVLYLVFTAFEEIQVRYTVHLRKKCSRHRSRVLELTREVHR